jgi:hypothetical protein
VCLFFEGEQEQEDAIFQRGRGCLIHAYEGAEAKPLDCQRFPFAQSQWWSEGEIQTQLDASGACSMIAQWFIPQWLKPRPSALESVAVAQASAFPLHASPTVAVDEPKEASLLHWYAWQRFMPAWFQRWQGVTLQQWQRALAALRHWHYGEPSLPLYGFISLAQHTCLHSKAVLQSESVLTDRGWRFFQSVVSGGVLSQLQQAVTALQVLLLAWAALRFPYGWYGRLHWLFSGEYQDPLVFAQPVQVSLWQCLRFAQHPEVLQWAKAFYWQVFSRVMGLRMGLGLHRHAEGCLAGVGLWLFYAAALHQQQTERNDSSEAVVDVSLLALATRIVERYYTAHQPRYWL